MSFNDYSNYPAGAANDPNAPYNQSDPSLELEVSATYTITNSDKVDVPGAYKVVDYDEDGAYEETITEGCDFGEAWETYNHTPIQLFAILKELAEEKLKAGDRSHNWKYIAHQCEGWEITESEFELD